MSATENLQAVLAEIENARLKRTVARDEEITLVAVTKNHGVELMREVIDAGANNIGENRIQEAAEKFQILNRNVTRHLIGHLQSNKVKQAVKLFDLIQSVDSRHLAEALDKAAALVPKIQDILIQVNLARESQKSGVELENLNPLISFVEESKNLRLRGLMMIAPNFTNPEDCRPLFAQMRILFDKLKTSRKDFDFLSMGMTNDYKIAIEEGANVVRLGTAIFGERSLTNGNHR
ncbi:MAG: YggS family pyridoxal phosphate-dependent enzyme [Selenomonadaceae bacterium]|nr:YggS family pyridoxal phosphate-dependent enzyme [Selenomonadaceae bacterium]